MWYLPEHTLAAYYYAFFEGAHFIDVDVHPTRDGKFIVYHDPVLLDTELSGLETFDPELKLKESFTNKINKREFKAGSGWMVKDFTSKELK